MQMQKGGEQIRLVQTDVTPPKIDAMFLQFPAWCNSNHQFINYWTYTISTVFAGDALK